MRLIDADLLKKHIYSLYRTQEQVSAMEVDEQLIMSTINNQPTIDAEPVVRCKDCKHHYIHEGRVMCNTFSNLFAAAENHYCSYCSYGAKMDEEQG